MEIRIFYRHNNRDSMLMPMDQQTVDLMLQYRIYLVRCEPTMSFTLSSGTYSRGHGILHDEYGQFHLDPWTDAEWLTFRNNFVETIRRYWDSKFELTPNRPWYLTGGPGSATTAAKVTCSLSLELLDSPANAHQTYYIIKPRETNFRSFADPDHRRGLFTHRDLSLHWVTRRTQMGSVEHSVSFLQCTVLHEFGHTLGLHHVAGTGNDDSNYGTTLEQREDLMGMGDHVTATEAQPWIAQLPRHLIRAHGEAPLTWTATVVSPQLITYWDNDWQPTPATSTAP